MKRLQIFIVSALLVSALIPVSSDAAMQIRKRPSDAPVEQPPAAAPAQPEKASPSPAKEEPARKPSAQPEKASPAAPAKEESAKKAAAAQAGQPEPMKRESFIGSVEFIQGKIIIVESDQALTPKQRLIVYDTRLQKRGILKVGASQGKDIYVATLTAGTASVGDRVVRETEEEAFSRVQRTRLVATVREFLETYPDSPHKPEAALKMFKLKLKNEFPVDGGSSITGQVKLAEKVGQKIEMSRAMIKLDRFIIAMTDEEGRYSITGIPLLTLPVQVPLTVIDEKFTPAETITIDLPADKAANITQDIPVKLTPTYLTGGVVDEKGVPLRGVQVWTSPYTMEKLTDEKGEFKISRKKKLDDSGNPQEGDEPVLGRDYDVYAYKQGYGAEKVSVSARSFKDNPVKQIKLTRQSSLEENLPTLDVSLRENLDLMQYVVSAGAGPKINR